MGVQIAGMLVEVAGTLQGMVGGTNEERIISVLRFLVVGG